MSAYELNNFIFLAARIPQIISNYKVSELLPCDLLYSCSYVFSHAVMLQTPYVIGKEHRPAELCNISHGVGWLHSPNLH